MIIMVATILFIAYMALLFKFSEIDKGWLWFVLIVGLLAEFGLELGVIGSLVALVLYKVVKEILDEQ